jgi:hypothetical protein
VYSREFVFKEIRGKSEHEEGVQSDNNPNMVWFKLRNEEYYSDELNKYEENVEQLTLVVRRSERVKKLVERYILPNIRSAFVLTSIDDEPKSIGEAFNLVEGKI